MKRPGVGGGCGWLLTVVPAATGAVLEIVVERFERRYVVEMLKRVANLERAQLLVQSTSRQALQKFVRDWRAQLDTIKPRVARWSLDVDPLVF